MVSAALPPDPCIPRLLGSLDEDGWVVLVLEDVAGQQPATPWAGPELARVMRTLAGLAERLTPPPPVLGPAASAFAADFAGWSRIADDPPAVLDPWVVENLGDLIGLAAVGVSALTGETVVHTDVRADNLLVRLDGSVVLVDWPHACVGPAWLDRLLLLVNVELFGGHDVEALVRQHVHGAGTDPPAEVVTAVLAGLAGYFADAARKPPPPGLPTVRAFQQAQAVTTLAWVRRRLG